MNIIEKSLKYRQVTLSVLVVLFIFGVYSLIRMPRREDPKISIPQALVVAYYPGASSEEVEQQVTKHIEEFLFKFEEIKKSHTTSSSQNGKAVITVELNDNVGDKDLFWNKLRNELLVMKQQKLPSSVVGPIVNSEFGDTEALIIGLSGKNVPYDQLRQYARVMEEDLRLIPSVSKIKRDGERDMQINVFFDDARLAQYGLTLSDVIKVLQSQNDIYPAGNLKTVGTDIAFHANGFYDSIEALANQIVGASKTGQDVRLKDIARIDRDYVEPSSMVKVGDEDAVIVSIESMSGKNIEDFGKDVDRVLEKFKSKIPSSVHLTYISNQPEIVHTNISHFIREFFIAIIAVILIIMLMLPFRIALVASMAIPMTVTTTLAIMNLCGIELQQVSLAALITVLGLVVDDAIVVADNYVEQLDNGESRWNAAWKSASELIVPILVATLTIIFAFMPMVILTGAVGDFIHTLPLTVSIALASSFIVAMFFTPFLCYVFVKKGLHDPGAKSAAVKKKSNSFLDRIQDAYNRSLDWSIAHKTVTIIAGIIPLVLAGLLYKFAIRQQFMPSAERNQFVVELWMPTGTQIEATEAAAEKLAALLDGDERVVNHATFVGTSAPRFYYNHSPEFPTPNFAQIVINTTSNETTLELADDLTRKVEEAVPDGLPKVRLMQQGKPLKAQIEARIWGKDISKLKAIGSEVVSILRKTQGTAHVRSDFHEDYYALDFRMKPEAQRLGFTNEAIALQMYSGFTGAPVTTIREGDNNVTVLARLDTVQRSSVSDIRRMYLTSPVTGNAVPFDQIAEIVPVWQNGRIMHRSGICVLTIESETDGRTLASEILKEVKPQIAALSLPEGYSITYGGEEANQNDTFPEMVSALGIGLLLIFFILLLQFRDLKETFVILLTIPLSVFGAMLGLWVTGNNFGFTAFVGVICLSGIVVRNSIILIDHIHELVDKHGMDWRTATIESGKRRLRPIFLTAMAAAFGVIPMILSGSSMWSPLASIIAFGVVWSMFVALLVVPVIYLLWVVPGKTRGMSPKAIAVIALLLAPSLGANAQVQADPVSLDDVINQALEHNNMLHAGKLRITEMQEKAEEIKIKRYPSLSLNSMYMYRFNLGDLSFPAGAFGTFQMPTGTDLMMPQSPVEVEIGKHNTFMAGATLYQPLTQQWKLSSGIKAAEIDRDIAAMEYDRAELQVVNGVEKLYYGILAVRKRIEENNKRIESIERRNYDAESAVAAGKSTDAATLGMTANLAARRQDLLKLRIEESGYISDLEKLTGADFSSVQFTGNFMTGNPVQPLPYYLDKAESSNVDLQLADLKIRKAEQGIAAAKRSYLPDVGLMAGYSYQNSIKILPENSPSVGASFSWNIQDIFSNRRVVKQRQLQLEQAVEYREYTSKSTVAEVENAYRQLLESGELINVTSESVRFRKRNLGIEYDRQAAGLNTMSDVLEAEAEYAKAEADYYSAMVNYRVMMANLVMLTSDKAVR